MSQLHELTAVEQVRLLGIGEITSLELTEHYLGRIARANPKLDAFTTVTDDAARERAAALDVAGRPGLLHGLPLGDKDLLNRAGVPTSCGSRVMAGFVPQESDPLVNTLDGNGGVSLGKTNAPEFGFACCGENLLPGGGAKNPWDTALGPGGSSSGAAVAVAAHLLPVAAGSDGGGSVRIPAAATGLVGLKPSRGRIPDASGLGSLAQLVVGGPLARTVADAALLLDAMIARNATGQPANRYAVCAPPEPRCFSERLVRTPSRRRLRIAWNTWSPWSLRYEITLHDDAIAALDAARTVARTLGHEVVEFTPADEPDYFDAFRAVWRGNAAALPLNEAQLALVEPLTRWLVGSGRALPVAVLVRAISTLAAIERRIIAQYAPFDIVLTPAMAMPPRPLGWFDDRDGERNFRQQCQYTPFTSYLNVAGLPAISLPVLATPLPMAVQAIGRPGEEATLLEFARDLEREFCWDARVAPSIP